MTLHAYQTLYESSIAFGIRKALQAEQVSNWPHSMTGLSYECGLVRNQKLFPFLMFNESGIVLSDFTSGSCFFFVKSKNLALNWHSLYFQVVESFGNSKLFLICLFVSQCTNQLGRFTKAIK